MQILSVRIKGREGKEGEREREREREYKECSDTVY